MPRRQNIREIQTPENIMGDGAWVKMIDITVDQANEYRSQVMKIEKRLEPERKRLFEEFAIANSTEDEKLDPKNLTDTQKALAVEGSEILKEAETFFYNYFSTYISDWNWVNEDGSDMEKPYKNPAVFGKLTSREFEYLQSLFSKDEIETKN